MEQFLMLKDVPVYDITSDVILDYQRLPGLMRTANFQTWIRRRYSSSTNTIARRIQGLQFGQGHRQIINSTTRALSLSDCYWIKDRDDPVTFEQVSPYYAPFWTGEGVYSGQAVPTLYVGGYLPKYWADAKHLVKQGPTAGELTAIAFCKSIGVECVEAAELPGVSGIALVNFTSPDLMLEQADMCDEIDPDDFTEEDIVRAYGLQGVEMILVDAMLGNGDRHAGNFGHYRDANTGVRLGRVPLYDFDHAFDSTAPHDRLTQDATRAIPLQFREQALALLDRAIDYGLPAAMERAYNMKEALLHQ